ncbi:UNVERIFIED_CONTAM: hypothetical protein FKN15_005084 [Acipenser sinensis]
MKSVGMRSSPGWHRPVHHGAPLACCMGMRPSIRDTELELYRDTETELYRNTDLEWEEPEIQSEPEELLSHEEADFPNLYRDTYLEWEEPEVKDEPEELLSQEEELLPCPEAPTLPIFQRAEELELPLPPPLPGAEEQELPLPPPPGAEELELPLPPPPPGAEELELPLPRIEPEIRLKPLLAKSKFLNKIQIDLSEVDDWSEATILLGTRKYLEKNPSSNWRGCTNTNSPFLQQSCYLLRHYCSVMRVSD